VTADESAQPIPAPKPKIVVFSGPRATIQNSAPLVTSADSPPGQGFDLLRSQLLAAPVTVYIEAFSAHPLEKDVAELYGPPDGWVDPDTGEFSTTATDTATRPGSGSVTRSSWCSPPVAWPRC